MTAAKDESIDYREILRKVPLYNKYGSEYPRGVPPQITDIPNFKIQPLPPLNELFGPWIQECDELIAQCEEYEEGSAKFDEFYFKKYLSTKPASMLDNKNILSPK